MASCICSWRCADIFIMYRQSLLYCFMNSRKNVVSIKLNCTTWSPHFEKNWVYCSQVKDLPGNIYLRPWTSKYYTLCQSTMITMNLLQFYYFICIASLHTYSLCDEDICKGPRKIIWLNTSVIIKHSYMLAQVMTTICSNPWLVCPSPQITNLHMSSKIPITSWFSKAPYESSEYATLVTDECANVSGL